MNIETLSLSMREMITDLHADHFFMKQIKASQEDRDALRESLRLLPPAQQRVIELLGGFDGDPQSMKEVADSFAITPQRVWQIRHKAIERLRLAYGSTVKRLTFRQMYQIPTLREP